MNSNRIVKDKRKEVITFYGYKKCSTCRNAEAYFAANRTKYMFVDITTHPPSRSELNKILEISGEPIKRLFNTSGVVYREMNLKDKVSSMTKEEALTLLASNGKLIKRPLAFDGKSVTIGFDENVYKKIWG